MDCTHCGHGKVNVVETRSTPKMIYRVRNCPKCGWRFTTHEKPADKSIIPPAVRRGEAKGKKT